MVKLPGLIKIETRVQTYLSLCATETDDS